ncbi:hypothetical protein NE236_23085 [Actinoallomurus purpureus]|uniref:hypothetical protein n=1 Tax=Actinoallomurus purpureus TaxID=478114 RepID=UPI00209397FB|nr:hypothetical protein [Actinoallomurus purpureus]MCO6007868.1 hypothetical protein [Actinoallomurus purpureus]
MRRSLAMAGAVLGAALGLAGCRQGTGPADHDVNLSHPRTAQADARHVSPGPGRRAGREPRPGPPGVRDKVARDVPALPRRPPARPESGCATLHEPGHGVSVRCVQRSGDDIDRSGDNVLRSGDGIERSGGDVLRDIPDGD